MTDTADLEKRLRERAPYYEEWARDIRKMNGHSVDADHADATARDLRQAADALSSLTRKLEEAHKIASDKAFERDAEADRLYARGLQYDGSICKMQGATAAVIANDILAIMRGSNQGEK